MLGQLALATGVGYLAAAYTVSRWLTRPSPGRPKFKPEQFGLECEPVECSTVDRLRLAGWALTPRRPRGTVALFHGLRQGRGHTLSRCAILTNAGYRCVTFDLRAHGQSTGKRTSFGFHESRDVAAVLSFVRERWPHQPHGVLGMSMGAAAVCYAAAHVRACQAVILESCYHDVHTAFENRLRHGYPPWVTKLRKGVVWVTERRLGIRLDDASPARFIGELCPAPVLLLTGSEDPLATPEESTRLYERCRGPRELWLVPGANHKDVVEVGGDVYRERIVSFLDRRMQRAAA
jgi:alpha-beta hydrolase superfamily lysophospholipase